MKTGFYLIAACFVSVCACISAWGTEYLIPSFVVSFVVVILCTWGYSRSSRKAASRRLRERMFEEHMRSFHNHLRY